MEKYKIEIKRSAVIELYSIPQKEIGKIESLSSNPRPEDCTKLTNREDYRVRVVNYRIIY
jgi:mRNA interferase RelE/StbE